MPTFAPMSIYSIPQYAKLIGCSQQYVRGHIVKYCMDQPGRFWIDLKNGRKHQMVKGPGKDRFEHPERLLRSALAKKLSKSLLEIHLSQINEDFIRGMLKANPYLLTREQFDGIPLGALVELDPAEIKQLHLKMKSWTKTWFSMIQREIDKKFLVEQINDEM